MLFVVTMSSSRLTLTIYDSFLIIPVRAAVWSYISASTVSRSVLYFQFCRSVPPQAVCKQEKCMWENFIDEHTKELFVIFNILLKLTRTVLIN